MKSTFTYIGLALVAILLGIAAGVGFGWWEFSNTPEHFFKNQWSRIDKSTTAPRASLLGSNTHRFESLKLGESASHDFIIENSGTSDLTIQLVDQSENVEIILPDSKVLLPGRTLPVTIRLRDTSTAGEFKAFAVIGTNDPADERKQFRFEITGNVSGTEEKCP